MTVAGMVVIYLTGVVFGVGGASLYVALRRAKPRKKEWGDTLTLVCPMCRTEIGRASCRERVYVLV